MQGDFNKLWLLFDKAFWDTAALWITRVPVRPKNCSLWP